MPPGATCEEAATFEGRRETEDAAAIDAEQGGEVFERDRRCGSLGDRFEDGQTPAEALNGWRCLSVDLLHRVLCLKELTGSTEHSGSSGAFKWRRRTVVIRSSQGNDYLLQP